MKEERGESCCINETHLVAIECFTWVGQVINHWLWLFFLYSTLFTLRCDSATSGDLWRPQTAQLSDGPTCQALPTVDVNMAS